jgi:serine/threonine-protein kinase
MLCDQVSLLTLRLEASEGTNHAGMTKLSFGPYQVLAQIGVGGMATVYRAMHGSSGTSVAVKVLRTSGDRTEELLIRLQREVDALQRLDHPNVIQLLDVGEMDLHLGGGAYLVMECLPNALDRVLRSQYPEPLSPMDALRIAYGVVDALVAVHEAGIIHRDVKPSNVLLREDGTPVLTDFGLAQMLAHEQQAQRLTASNVIVGTADYLSPEQVAGLPLDGRCDLYALGIMLYEMLAGHVPFAGRAPMATLRAHVEESPPPLPERVPPATRAVVEQALQKRPQDRYVSAEAMLIALQEALAHA